MVRRPLGESFKGGRTEKRQVLMRLSFKGYLKGGATASESDYLLAGKQSVCLILANWESSENPRNYSEHE